MEEVVEVLAGEGADDFAVGVDDGEAVEGGAAGEGEGFGEFRSGGDGGDVGDHDVAGDGVFGVADEAFSDGGDLFGGLELEGGVAEDLVEDLAAVGELEENFGGDADEGGRFGGDGVVVPDFVVEEGAFAEMVAGAEGEGDAVAVHQVEAAGFDDVEGEGGFAFVEEEIALGEVDVLEGFGVAGAELVDVAGEEEVEGPVDHDPDFAVEAGEFGEVDGAPHEPGDEAGEFEAFDVGDGDAVSDGGEFAEAGEGEGLRLPASGEGGGDVGSHEFALAHGELGGGGAEGAAFEGNGGAISGGPDFAGGVDLEERVGEEASAFGGDFVLGGEFDGEGVGGVSDGGDDGVGFDAAAVVEDDAVGGDGADALAEDDVEAAFLKFSFGVGAEFEGEAGEEGFAAVDEDDVDVGGVDVVVIFGDGAAEIEDLPGGFDSGIAAADNDHGEEAAFGGGVFLEIGFFEAADDGGAEAHGVADVSHEERVLGHAGDHGEIDDGAEREDEVVEADFEVLGEMAGVEADGAGGEIDGAYFSFQYVDVAAELADGVDDVARGDAAADDFGEHRLVDHVVFFRDEADAEGGVAAETFAEGAGAIDARESSAGDENVEFLHRNSLESHAVSPRRAGNGFWRFGCKVIGKRGLGGKLIRAGRERWIAEVC